ncbi:MAG: hypothetical protein WBA63_08115 [Thermomicrobiales bacterium]
MTTPSTRVDPLSCPRPPVQPHRKPKPPRPHNATLAAAAATLRRSDDIAAVFVITPREDGSSRNDLTVFRNEPGEPPEEPKPSGDEPHHHTPRWALTLLESTEGVR